MRSANVRASRVAVACLLASTTACSSWDNAAPTPVPDAGGTTESLQVWVGDANEHAGDCDPASAPPVSAAAIAVDLPGGRRLDLKTGADGRATIDGIDWSAGRMSITAWAAGRVVGSVLGMGKANLATLGAGGVFRICLLKRPAATTVDVTGVAKNMTDTSHSLIVSASDAPGQVVVSAGTSPYSLPVWTGGAGMVVACEMQGTVTGRTLAQTFFGWTKADHPALQSTATLDLDFATKLPTSKVSGHLKLPSNATSALRTRAFGYLRVSTFESASQGTVTGLPTSSAPNAAGDMIDFSAEYVDLPSAGTPVTLYVLQVNNAVQSFVWRRGTPKDGATIDGFLDAFTLVQPRGTASLHADIEIASPDSNQEGVAPGIALANAKGELAWTAMSWNRTVPTFRLPDLPAGVAVSDALGDGPYVATPYVWADIDPRYGAMRLATISATVKLTP